MSDTSNSIPTMHPGSATPPRTDGVRLLRRLWEQRPLLARFLLIGAALSAVTAILIPAQYSASTKLMPPDTKGGVSDMLAAVSGSAGVSLGGDLMAVKQTGPLFIGVLRSRAVQDELIEKFDLRRVYRTPLMEDARRALLERTAISEELKSGIINISVTDRDPGRAAKLANAYATTLGHVFAKVGTSAARRQRIFLEERLVAVKADLDHAASSLSQFSTKSGTIDLAVQSKAMLEAVATLQARIIIAKADLQALRQNYSDTNSRVRAADAQLEELKRQLARLGGGSESGVMPQSGDASQYPSVRELPRLAVTYSDLYRRTRIQEAVYESLTRQYELAKVEEAKEIPTVKVLDVANVPERKSFPPRTLITVLGALLAIGVGMIAVIGTTLWGDMEPGSPLKSLVEEMWLSIKLRPMRIKGR